MTISTSSTMNDRKLLNLFEGGGWYQISININECYKRKGNMKDLNTAVNFDELPADFTATLTTASHQMQWNKSDQTVFNIQILVDVNGL